MEVLSILVLSHFESTESVFFCQGEGVAYRGRVLIELETKMDTQPTKLVQDVLSDDIVRVQVCNQNSK